MSHKIDNITQYFNISFEMGLKQIVSFSLNNPRLASSAGRLYFAYRLAERKRKKYLRQGVQIPPMIIFSVTNDCNLDCAGCYAKILHQNSKKELTATQFRAVIQQAKELGVSVILLAGGEPLLRPGLLDTIQEFPNLIFLLFTNGTLLDEAAIQRIKRQGNILPVISIEGDQQDTDLRRGGGIYERAVEVFSALKQEKMLFGTSITQTSRNFELVNNEEYLIDMMDKGCKVFFFINYLPIDPQTRSLALTTQQVMRHLAILEELRMKFPALFMAFPGGEMELGGCLAGAKGLIHINPQGEVQPCPFSPFSDANLQEVSLLSALRSPHLQVIRNSGDRLDESDGACALWKNKTWVEELYKK
ncbi:MAG: radical SAM protein [Pelolinea sp.]|jgi:MoaA/NifB/PqqE/SkfB family radical SAM enzyme|nr:radical SAM protein [Pelolinea sp.]